MPAGGVNSEQRTPVLYLAPWVDYGGSDKGTIDWFRWIDRDRFSPSLICTQPSENRRLAEIEPYADEIWALPDLMPAECFPQFIFDFIDSRGVEVVHIMNSRLVYDLLPDFASLKRPPRIVVQLHVEEQTRDGYVRYVTTRFGNLVDAFSVTSEHLADAVAGYDVPRDRVHVIYTGVDAEDEFSPERVAPVGGVEPDAVNILYPGRLCAQKDPHLMVDVATSLRTATESFRIHVVGDGELEPEIRAAVRERGLESCVRFHPPTREIARWYAAADVLLMTSVFEGVPYVVYEAMAMGLPTVAPALPGNLELLGSDHRGLVDPREDVEAYVERLRELVLDADRRKVTGTAARIRARESFSLRAMAAGHEDLYDELLRGRSRRAGEGADSPRVAQLRFGSRPLRDQPLVSVIVPCFNHGRYLRATLESIARQTYPAIETIVVDDCSTDAETRGVLAALESSGRVRVIRQPQNRGPSAARNRAIDVATGRYVLPMDADNLLVEDAVEQLVTQLQEAGEQVGYVYPNLQFFGNRDDYFEPPRYNEHLLLHGNYCDTSSLFDRDIFDAGLRFDEDIVLGHEDWDFVLTLAEHGVRGERARGKTLLYRKHGFSRADTVDHAQEPFHESVRERHPLLYGDGAHLHPFVTAKAQSAPELSVIALEPLAEWPEVTRQSCWDFELVAFAEIGARGRCVGPSIVRLPVGLALTGPERLELGVAQSKGRIVLALGESVAELLAEPAFVEKLIRLFEHDAELDAVAFATGADGGHAWRTLREDEEVVSGPHALAWRRECMAELRDPLWVSDGDECAAVLRWLATAGTTADWRHLEIPATRLATERPVSVVRLGGSRRKHRSSTLHEPQFDRSPAIPRMSDSVRRWCHTPTWMPPLTTLLCRHREIGGERRRMTNTWHSPHGYELEHALGCVKLLPYAGTTRLFALDEVPSYRVVPVELGPFEPPEGTTLLGHLELAHFPLLSAVVLARDPATDQQLLVGGPDDILADVVEPLATLGFVEPFPLEPRRRSRGVRAGGLRGLMRSVARAERRHRYGVGEAPAGSAAGELGALLDEPQFDTEPVWLTYEGLFVTQTYRPAARRPSPLRVAKWAGAPLRWSGPWGPVTRSRSVMRRSTDSAGALMRKPAAPHVPADAAPAGYLLRQPGPSRVALYSATHPVTHDQLLTTNPREATDLGYDDVTRLGYLVATAPVSGRLGPLAVSVPWGSRFGAGAARR